MVTGQPAGTATSNCAQDVGGKWSQLSGSVTERATMREDSQREETKGKKESHLLHNEKVGFSLCIKVCLMNILIVFLQ